MHDSVQSNSSDKPKLIMNRAVSSKCFQCPTFRAGRCSGTAKRLLATDAAPLTRKDKKEGDISSVFSTFSGRKIPPLPERFRELKRNLTTGFEEQIQKSWDELVEVLKVRTEEVASKRESVCLWYLTNYLATGHMLKVADYSPAELFRHPRRQRISGDCCSNPTNRCRCRQRGGAER